MYAFVRKENKNVRGNCKVEKFLEIKKLNDVLIEICAKFLVVLKKNKGGSLWELKMRCIRY